MRTKTKKINIQKLNDWMYQAKAEKQVKMFVVSVVITFLALIIFLAGSIREEKNPIKVINNPNQQSIRVIESQDHRTIKILSTRKIPQNPIIQEIIKHFPECPEIAIAIAKAESRLNPQAIGYNTNGSIDRGLFQINSIHGLGEELYNYRTNIQVARKIYEKRGWSAWSAYTNGSYKKHL